MNNRIVITGASKGIGKEFSLLAAEKGYDLLLISRNKEALEKIKREIADKYDTDVIICPGDLAALEDIERIESVIRNTKDILALVNNAGISYVGLLQDMKTEEWNEVMNINLNAMFHTSRAVIPQMIHNKAGKIINISSMWGNVGASMEVAYSASKGGVNAFTRALAKELAPSNIQVNAIAFGVIDTTMNAHLNPMERQMLSDDIPMGRMATPMEAAWMIMNVMTSVSYMTGQVISMDGGYI